MNAADRPTHSHGGREARRKPGRKRKKREEKGRKGKEATQIAFDHEVTATIARTSALSVSAEPLNRANSSA